MIPIIQTKVVVKNSKDEEVVRGNCYAAVIASMLELPITEVPNVEVFFHIPNSSYWQEVMLTFLNSKGWDLCSDDRFKVFHDKEFGVNKGKRDEYLNECRNKFYFVSGKSARGVHHICIYLNGKLVHDPHPSGEGLLTEETFQTLEKKQSEIF
jgi:hypothetical protein